MRKLLICSIVAGSVWFGAGSSLAQAAVQDTDLDSLTDESERSVYGTDPTLFDSDGDGIGDGEEVLDSTNPLDPGSSHLATLKTSADPGILGEGDKRAWYFGRASGLAAFLLFTLVVIYGLLSKSQLLIRTLPGATLTAVHEYLSLSALAVGIAHIASFFFDRYMHISIVEALVPFYLRRDFSSALGLDIGIAIGLGILALYLGLILVLTSLYRHKLPLKLWRGLHYLSFAFYLLIILHGLAAGTDSTNTWIQAMYGGSFAIVMLLVIVRISAAVKLRRMLAAAKLRQVVPAPTPTPPPAATPRPLVS